jgi:hypothetical protein
MKKLIVALSVVVGLGLLLVIVVGLALGSIVRNSVNRIGPQITRTPVVLEDAQLSPFSGSGTLRGLFVGNPEGWSGEKAFSLGEVRFQVQPRSLLSETIIIDELIVQRPEFVYEQRLTGGSNIRDLLENIRRVIGTRAERPDDPTEPPRKFIIHRLRLTDGVAHVGLGPAAVDVPLPELSYDELGVAEGGLTAAELAQVVLGDVLGRVISVAAASGQIRVPEGAGQILDAVGGALQGGELQRLLRGREAPPPEPKK